MLEELFKRGLLKRIIAVGIIIGLVLTSGSVSYAGVDKLRPSAADGKKGVTDEIRERLLRDGISGGSQDNEENIITGIAVPLQKSRLFKIGSEPVNPGYVVDNFAVSASVKTAVDLTKQGLRGAALGVRDKSEIANIKANADGLAKRMYEGIVKQGKVILVVRVSEGIGRDGVAESFKANDVIVPDELLGELEEIKKAIGGGFVQYTSKTGTRYSIKNAVIDVIEGTNAFVTNVDGKELKDLKNSESGATSVIVISDGRLLGNCPDIYADGIFTLVPKSKRKEFINNPLDPELTAKNPNQIGDVLTRIAEANGITINDLEVVLMDRAREAQRLAALKELQARYPGLEITAIKDGTVAHSLLATFGRKEGKHKVVMTVGGAPEVFLNTSVASLFKNEGALASLRIYSKSVNTTAEGKEAQDLIRRYAFDNKEAERLRKLRPDDAEAILYGGKLFTQEDVQGDVEGVFSFITNNGVFNMKSVEEVTGGSKVNVLRVGTINGKPGVWISEKIIDPDKDESQNFVNSIPDNQPLLSFTNIESVKEALKGIVEVTPGGVKIVDEGQLREYLIDQLVYDATFNPDKNVVGLCRQLIKDIAVSQGTLLKSVYDLYVKKAKDPANYTVPAINIRGMAYNTARAVFASARNNKVGVMILEIAKSEIGYTAQRPAEFTASILAAAIKEGYKHTVFLQGDHFQIAAKDYMANPDKARDGIKALIREAIEAGFYQVDLDMSTLVDWTKTTPAEQQTLNYKETALLTAFVRDLERELGLDKLGIVVNLGGEIGEIGMGLEKGKERNSSVDDLRAFWGGYKSELEKLSQGKGYEIIPITKIAIQTGTKHGGIRDAHGKVVSASLSFNTIAELGKVARGEYGLAGVVQHGASTLDPNCFVVFTGSGVPVGFQIPSELLNQDNTALLSTNPSAEVHLATAYQDTAMDHPVFPQPLLSKMRDDILKKNPPKEGQDPNKVFVDNRKNAWGPFKAHVWNLPDHIQGEIRKSLIAQFGTVFTNLGVKDSHQIIAQASLQQLMTVDNTSYNGSAVGFDNFANALKETKFAKGALVVSANTILENSGALSTLKKIKENSGELIKIAVWAKDEASVGKLKVMGIGEVADIISFTGVDDILSMLSKEEVAQNRIALLISEQDNKSINLEDLKARGINVLNLKNPEAGNLFINSMPLAVARAVAGILQDNESMAVKYKDFLQRNLDNKLISEQNYNALANLTISEIPLLKVNEEKAKEVLAAQIVYKATVGQI